MKALISGAKSKTNLEEMADKLVYLGIEPVIIPIVDKKGFESYETFRKRYEALLEVDILVLWNKATESVVSWSGIEVKMAEQIGVPVYYGNQIDENIIRKVLGKEIIIGNEESVCDDTSSWSSPLTIAELINSGRKSFERGGSFA